VLNVGVAGGSELSSVPIATETLSLVTIYARAVE
jgi:hypothetical protein